LGVWAREVGELAAVTSPQPRQLHEDADEYAHAEPDERHDEDAEHGQRGHDGGPPRSYSSSMMINAVSVSCSKRMLPL
jgi:hypothetical protein